MFWDYLEIEGYCDWDDSAAARLPYCPGRIAVQCLYVRHLGGPCDHFSCCRSDRVLQEIEIELPGDSGHLRIVVRGEDLPAAGEII